MPCSNTDEEIIHHGQAAKLKEDFKPGLQQTDTPETAMDHVSDND
jgi:hypothetical protein